MTPQTGWIGLYCMRKAEGEEKEFCLFLSASETLVCLGCSFPVGLQRRCEVGVVCWSRVEWGGWSVFRECLNPWMWPEGWHFQRPIQTRAANLLRHHFVILTDASALLHTLASGLTLFRALDSGFPRDRTTARSLHKESRHHWGHSAWEDVPILRPHVWEGCA